MKRVSVFLVFFLVFCVISPGCFLEDEGEDEAPPAGEGTLNVTVTYNGDFGVDVDGSREGDKINSGGVKIWFDGTSLAGDVKPDILLPSGCSALYKKKMLDEVGLYDERFFAYCEDTDLGLRARMYGWKAKLASEAIVYHHYSGTTTPNSLFKLFHIERNRIWVMWKNYPLELILISFLFTIYRYLFYMLVPSVDKPNIGVKYNVIKAHLASLRGIFSTKRRVRRRIFYPLLFKYRLKYYEMFKMHTP